MARIELYNEDRTVLFRQVAENVFERISATTDNDIVLGICGGRSIVGVLEAMAAERARLPEALWRRLQIFMIDERIVPLDHEDSNFRLVNELFFKQAIGDNLLMDAQIHPFPYAPDRAEETAANYTSLLERVGGRFHVVFLGVGEDGHVAGLFPGIPWSESRSFFTFDGSPKPPPRRMSGSPALIRGADLAVGLFLGDAKRDALNRYRDPAVAVDQCPAKLIDEAGNTLLVTDLLEEARG